MPPRSSSFPSPPHHHTHITRRTPWQALSRRSPAEVQLDKSFTEDLDIDSLSMMTIVVNAEERFGVRIPDDEVKNLTTVGDAVRFIQGSQA